MSVIIEAIPGQAVTLIAIYPGDVLQVNSPEIWHGTFEHNDNDLVITLPDTSRLILVDYFLLYKMEQDADWVWTLETGEQVLGRDVLKTLDPSADMDARIGVNTGASFVAPSQPVQEIPSTLHEPLQEIPSTMHEPIGGFAKNTYDFIATENLFAVGIPDETENYMAYLGSDEEDLNSADTISLGFLHKSPSGGMGDFGVYHDQNIAPVGKDLAHMVVRKSGGTVEIMEDLPRENGVDSSHRSEKNSETLEANNEEVLK